MAATTRLPLAVVLLLLLTASSAVPAIAGSKLMHSGARMVVVTSRGPGPRFSGVAGASNDKWRYGRLLEDEVAPEEFGGLLGAGDGNLGYGALDKDRPGCEKNGQCAGKPEGGSYTRPCTYKDHCPQ